MTSHFAAVKNAFSKIAARDFTVARTALRIAAKGAFLAMLALMIATLLSFVTVNLALLLML